ncbi:YjbH domain-containing protein [Marinilongibacter aquaticus]|uniref:YjbH domain-containing protein n=1 Tax=Marinilongibacter aquaticus TaxID=2975157 RepID=UPI0021BD8D16|nr:YjbH domain-containing protein [Marinilongibacter aquaticus]UBM58084.1 YjbH domain-containing protein [Marinilongibacter aquaticus]
MKSKLLWLLIGGLWLSGGQSFAQKLKDFERLHELDSVLVFEQRVHRNQWAYIQFLSEQFKAKSQFVPLYQGVPLAAYAKLDTKWKIGNKAEALPLPKWALQKGYKWDFWLQPDFKFFFGNKADPVESKGGLMLNTQLMLFKGMVLYTGLYVPLVNEFDNQPLNLRLSPTYFNYLHKVGKEDFLSISAGGFLQDRYGFQGEWLHYPLDKSWSYGLKGSYTGFYYFYPETLKYTSFRDFSVLGHVAYRFKKNNVSLRVSGGQFLYQDKGAKVELIRQFRKLEIGFYGVSTQNGTTIGVNLAFKIPPKGTLGGEHFRLRTAKSYAWQYVYSRGYKIGEDFRLYQNLERDLRQYHVFYWNQ